MLCALRPLLIALGVVSCGLLEAAPIQLEAVQATTGESSRLAEAVDGVETPGNGWKVPAAAAHSGIFRCVLPMEPGRVRFWLTFNGPASNSYFGEFSLSATSDPNPSSQSQWETVFPIGWNADQGWVSRKYPHVRMQGTTTKAMARIDGVLSQAHITGIRVEVWSSPDEKPRDSILTELRIERIPMGTTNIALGCPASVSYELEGNQHAEFLTDGLVGSYTYPGEKVPGSPYYFEIDLRRVHTLDHITLRGRAEAIATNRFSDMLLQLFDENPEADTTPVWSGQAPEADTVQAAGAMKVVRSSDGEGVFHGRYLRIISTSMAPYSPQIAEVEVYDSTVPLGAQVRANDHILPAQSNVRIPAASNWLGFTLIDPPLPDGMVLGRRWRIVGVSDAWLPANPSGGMETRALPPGEYLFEAQLRHSDLEWNSTSFRLPLIVPTPWWQNPWVQVGAVLVGAGVAALISWQFARRRLQRRLVELERRQELSKERARIARSMHDVVGARLTQLAVMHEIVAAQEKLTEKTRDKLEALTATARAAVSELDEAVWAVNPRNDTLQNVADYLCHAANDYLRPLEIRVRQHMPDSWPEREVNSQKRHELFLAFKEALQNLVKHSGATVATLTLRLEADQLILWLDDNGRGLAADVAGLEKDGLDNMRTRLAAVGGSCIVQACPEGGTRVELRLPV